MGDKAEEEMTEKWTRNQKILLWTFIVGIIVTILLAVVGFVFQYFQIQAVKDQQVIIKAEYDAIKSRIGEFEEIRISNIGNVQCNLSANGTFCRNNSGLYYVSGI
jgi:flagellar basal body-associated protein FliL